MARRPNDPEKELKVQWSKKEDDLVVFNPEKTTGHVVYGFLNMPQLWILPESSGGNMIELERIEDRPYMRVFKGKSFAQELKDRGYDITTLKITVKKKDV